MDLVLLASAVLAVAAARRLGVRDGVRAAETVTRRALA
jgi:hypothetical protein